MQRVAPPRLRGAGARAWPPGIAWSPKVEDAPEGAPAGSALWLEYSSDGPTWSYRIHGPRGRVQTWRIADPAHRREMRCSAWTCWLASSRRPRGRLDCSGRCGDGVRSDCLSGPVQRIPSALVATGALLSADRLSPTSARLYSDAVATTFLHREAGRISVYGAMPPAPQSWLIRQERSRNEGCHFGGRSGSGGRGGGRSPRHAFPDRPFNPAAGERDVSRSDGRSHRDRLLERPSFCKPRELAKAEIRIVAAIGDLRGRHELEERGHGRGRCRVRRVVIELAQLGLDFVRGELLRFGPVP